MRPQVYRPSMWLWFWLAAVAFTAFGVGALIGAFFVADPGNKISAGLFALFTVPFFVSTRCFAAGACEYVAVTARTYGLYEACASVREWVA